MNNKLIHMANKKKTGKIRYLLRKRQYTRRRKSTHIPMLPIAGITYSTLFKPHPMAAPDDTPIAKLTSGNYQGFLKDLVTQAACMTPEGKIDLGIGLQFYGPIVGGIAGHWLANRFGINRYLDKVPVVGKYLSL